MANLENLKKVGMVTLAAAIAIGCKRGEESESLTTSVMPEPTIDRVQVALEDKFPDASLRRAASYVVHNRGAEVADLKGREVQMNGHDMPFDGSWRSGTYLNIRDTRSSVSYYFSKEGNPIGYLEREPNQKDLWRAYTDSKHRNAPEYTLVSTETDQFVKVKSYFSEQEGTPAYTAWFSQNEYVKPAGKPSFAQTKITDYLKTLIDSPVGTTFLDVQQTQTASNGQTIFDGYLEVRGKGKIEHLGDGAYSNRHSIQVRTTAQSLRKARVFVVPAYEAEGDRENFQTIQKLCPDLIFKVEPHNESDDY